MYMIILMAYIIYVYIIWYMLHVHMCVYIYICTYIYYKCKCIPLRSSRISLIQCFNVRTAGSSLMPSLSAATPWSLTTVPSAAASLVSVIPPFSTRPDPTTIEAAFFIDDTNATTMPTNCRGEEKKRNERRGLVSGM